jgi:hypothetical protein
MRLPHLSDRTRLVLTALCLVIVITVSALLIPEKYAHLLEGKWLRFVVVTALLIFYELKAYWKLRKSGWFWMIFLSVLGGYSIWVGHFFYIGNGLSLVSFVLAGTAQFFCIAMLIYWLLGAGPAVVDLNF